MKSLALGLAALTLTASTAWAYAQPGHLPKTHTQTTETPILLPEDGQGSGQLPGITNTDPGRGRNRPAPDSGPGSGPTNPVPEPGTMMLASMGLIALGTAVRRRRY